MLQLERSDAAHLSNVHFKSLNQNAQKHTHRQQAVDLQRIQSAVSRCDSRKPGTHFHLQMKGVQGARVPLPTVYQCVSLSERVGVQHRFGAPISCLCGSSISTLQIHTCPYQHPHTSNLYRSTSDTITTWLQRGCQTGGTGVCVWTFLCDSPALFIRQDADFWHLL